MRLTLASGPALGHFFSTRLRHSEGLRQTGKALSRTGALPLRSVSTVTVLSIADRRWWATSPTQMPQAGEGNSRGM